MFSQAGNRASRGEQILDLIEIVLGRVSSVAVENGSQSCGDGVSQRLFARLGVPSRRRSSHGARRKGIASPK